MAETTFKSEKPVKPEERAAGRPKGYWQGLLSDASLAPVRKPEPKPKPERLPESQLRELLSSLGNRNLSEERGEYMSESDVEQNVHVINSVANWLDSLGDIHTEDAKKIIQAAWRSQSSMLQGKACKSIPILPSEEQVPMFELALAEMPGSRSFHDIFDSISKTCPETDRSRLARAALNSDHPGLQEKGLRLIFSLPEAERSELVVTALAKSGVAMGAFDRIEECPGQDRVRLISAAWGSPLLSVREKAVGAIPSLPADGRVIAIEVVLTDTETSKGAREAFDFVFQNCQETDKSRLIKAGLKSKDNDIAKRSLKLAEGRADEAELLMAVLEPAIETGSAYRSNAYHYRHNVSAPEFEVEVQAAERACSIPENPKLLETASKVMAQTLASKPNTRPGILLMIPKFPAGYRADIIEAALSSDELIDSIPLISGVLPAERRDALWHKAEVSVTNKLGWRSVDEKLAATFPLFPSQYRVNIINCVLAQDLSQGANSSQTVDFLMCFKTWELISGLDPEHQEKSWKLAQTAIINALRYRLNSEIRLEAVRLAVKLPTVHSEPVFWRIANSTYPNVHQEMDRLFDLMPSENQVAYLMQAFESYKSGTRRKAFEKTFSMTEEQQIELLECALESSYEDIRMIAVRRKRDIPEKTQMALLPSMIHDTDERIRIEATLSSPVGNEEMKKTVLSALKSDDQLVFLTALGLSNGLFSSDEQKNISSRAAYKKTKSALGSGQYDIRMKAADAIVAFDGRRKYALVKNALNSDHLGVRQKGIEHTFDYNDPMEQKKLAKKALQSRYGDNIVKIAFELLAEKDVTICGWQTPELLKLAEERLGQSLKWANVEANQHNTEAISYWNLERQVDRGVIAHAMQWPFPQRFSTCIIECAARSGPKGCLAIVKKKASFGCIRAYVLTNVLNQEKYWADAVEMIPSFPVSAEYHETRESLWDTAAISAEKALCSGVKPKKAGMLLKTFPKEHWPALVALRDKALPEPISFFIAALAVQMPEEAGRGALPWAAPLIATGLDSSDPAVCHEAVLCYPGIPKAYSSDSALAAAIGKFRVMLLSEDNTVSIRASERIGAFPKEHQPELIEAAMASNWWYTILNSMPLLQKLPPGLQREPSWGLAINHASIAHYCPVESIRAWAIDIAAAFPENRFAEVLAHTTPYSDKSHLENLIRRRMEIKKSTIPPNAVSCIAELPEGRRTEIYEVAIKSIASRLSSDDSAISKNASELMGIFPQEHQPELIEAAMASGWGFAAQAAIKLLMELPQELQAEKSWLAAQKQAKAALVGKPTSTGIPADTMLETVRKFPKQRQEAVLRDVFEGNPENVSLELVKLGIECDDTQIALDAVISACNLADNYRAMHPLPEGRRKVLLQNDDPVFLLVDALIPVLDALDSKDYPIVAKASGCISRFPLQFRAGMIKSLMDSGFWGPTLDGISMLQNLPIPMQSEELWAEAQSWMISAFSLDSDHLRQRAVKLLPGFPKSRLRLLIMVAELSEFDDVKNNLEEARMMENK